jgi:hypothetical protein
MAASAALRRGAALLILSCVAAPPEAGAAVADPPMVVAFRDTCLPARRDFDAMKAHVAAAGWSAATAADNPELAAILKRAEAAELPEKAALAMGVFRKSIDGSTFYLVATDVRSELIHLVSCYLYDFDATAPVDPLTMTLLLDKPPYQVIDQPGTMAGQLWKTPESLPGAIDAYSGFVPEGSEVAEQVGFTGQALRITSAAKEEPDQ